MMTTVRNDSLPSWRFKAEDRAAIKEDAQKLSLERFAALVKEMSVASEEEVEENDGMEDEDSRQKGQEAEEAERHAILAEEQELAALLQMKPGGRKLSKKSRARLLRLQRNAARRKVQQDARAVKEQAAIELAAIDDDDDDYIKPVSYESRATTGPGEDCFALVTNLSVVSDAIADDSADTLPTDIARQVEHHPKAGKSLMIRARAEPHYILTVDDGEVKLLSKPSLGGGYLWHCIRRNGWFAFRNSVTGIHLSHDGHCKIWAMPSHEKTHEHFMTERHEDGGYILVMRRGDALLQVAISEDGKRLIVQNEGGTAWDFIEARHLSSSMTLAYSSM
ncbi:hypothetical protein V8C35DRAFT_163430 [Trichoderma chlorosporum]